MNLLFLVSSLLCIGPDLLGNSRGRESEQRPLSDMAGHIGRHDHAPPCLLLHAVSYVEDKTVSGMGCVHLCSLLYTDLVSVDKRSSIQNRCYSWTCHFNLTLSYLNQILPLQDLIICGKNTSPASLDHDPDGVDSVCGPTSNYYPLH